MLQFQKTFATPHIKVLRKPIATQALATPRNAFIMLPLLILQRFWAYRNTFDVLQQRVNLVVIIASPEDPSSSTAN